MSSKLVNIIFKSSVFLFILMMTAGINACKKTAAEEPQQETGTVTDVEGNTYKTIKIGNQWWMAENLAVRKYNDKSDIKFLESNVDAKVEWEKDTIGAICNFSTSAELGLLYNWHAVNNAKGIAPEGQRIPTDEDWKELEKQLGMSADDANKTSWRGGKEGDKIKLESTSDYVYWTRYGEVWATNESGLSAKACGARMFDGSFGDMLPQRVTFFWSSTTNGNEVWYRHLDYQKSSIFRYYGQKNYGFSVRCIKK